MPLCTDRGNCFVREESPASFLAFPAEELRLHRLAVTIAAGPEEQRDLKLLLSCLCSAPVSTVLVRLVHTWLIVISKANVTLWPETAPSIWQLRFTRWNCHGHSSVCLSRDAGGKSGLLVRREVLSPQSSPLPVDSQRVTGPSRVKRFVLWTVEGLLVACWYLANVWVATRVVESSPLSRICLVLWSHWFLEDKRPLSACRKQCPVGLTTIRANNYLHLRAQKKLRINILGKEESHTRMGILEQKVEKFRGLRALGGSNATSIYLPFSLLCSPLTLLQF